MEKITSRNNPKIKHARALRQGRKYRAESGSFVVEGIRHVGEAVQAGAEMEAVFYAPDLLSSEFALSLLDDLAARGVPCYMVTEEAFTGMASKEHPQGLLAIVRQRRDRLAALGPENFPWGVALLSPQDPGNVGAILRTIDAASASGLLLLEEAVDPYHPSAVRASMGAIFWRPVVETSFEEFARWTKTHGYHVYGTSSRGSRDYRQVEFYERPAILLMGSEREGLNPEQASICEELVRLPMYGRVTSLNLAVATGIMLYAMLADRA